MMDEQPVVLAMIALALLMIADRHEGEAALQRALVRVKREIIPLLDLGATDE